MATKVFIADDHPIFRKGLVETIQQEDGFEVIAEAGDGIEAFGIIREKKPHIAVLDISMPGMNGLEIVQKIKEENLNVKCIIITMHKDKELLNKALEAGVKAYLLKEDSAYDLMIALKFVMDGRRFISPKISEKLIEIDEIKKSISQLTSSEKRIISLIAEKKTSKEIAEKLYVSARTVDTHRTNICSKLNVHGVNALVLFAIENKSMLESI